jgi:RND family efflux transporter MFP subunit
MSNVVETQRGSAAQKGSARLPGALVILLGIAAGGAFLLGHGRRRAEAEEARVRAETAGLGPFVEVAEVRAAAPERKLTLNGEVHALRESTLFAKVSGYLKLVRVDKGERVRAGDVLGVIEAPEVEQQIVSKKADVAIKKLTDARYHALAPTGVVSQEERDRAGADLQIAQADLATLDTLRGYQVIRAPFDGVITARYADPGALLQAATSSQSALPLVRIADIERVRILVYLGQNEALSVHEGDAATVWTDVDPGRRLEAKVTRFSKELDPRTRTMLTEIELDNREGQLYPGAFVRVGLTLAGRPSVLLPADALLFDSGKTAVATLRDGRAHFVAVEVADTDGKTVRAVPGAVEPGQKIILHPGDEVVDGAPVRVAVKQTSAETSQKGARGQ